MTLDPPTSSENAVRLWDAATGKPIGICTGHKQAVRAAAFSPDGRTLATSSDDSTLKLWTGDTQQELLSIDLENGPATRLLFAPDGSVLASCSGSAGSRTIRLFRAPRPVEANPEAQSSANQPWPE